MDSNNMIGGASWNPGLLSVRPAEGQKTVPASPAADLDTPALPGDRLDIQVASLDPPLAPPPLAEAPLPPPPSAAEPPLRTPIPVSLLAEDGPSLLGGVEPVASPVVGLGVLVQLDEPSALAGVRAIDDPPRADGTVGFTLIGPGNAGQYLADPSRLYVGI